MQHRLDQRPAISEPRIGEPRSGFADDQRPHDPALAAQPLQQPGWRTRRARRSRHPLAEHDILTIDRVEPVIEQVQHRLGRILVVGEAMQQFAAGHGRLGRQPGGEIKAQLRALDVAPARIEPRRPGESQRGFRHIAAMPQQMPVMQREFRVVRLGAAGALGGIERAVEPAAQHLGAGQHAPQPRRGRSRRGAAQQARRLLGTAAAHQHLGGVDHGAELRPAKLAPVRHRDGAHRPVGRFLDRAADPPAARPHEARIRGCPAPAPRRSSRTRSPRRCVPPPPERRSDGDARRSNPGTARSAGDRRRRPHRGCRNC